MELSVQKWGNSAAVRLPTELLGILKVNLGDKLSVNVQPEGVLLKAARPSYRLADLVAQCDLSAPEPADLAAWAHVRRVETVPEYVVEDALARLRAMTD